ncbi:MAG TPA: hypothetical protein VMH39_16180 [Gemmatimonadaceae bacterium]|nr:hypothetical protein [Gemmatimonadaceae bacterium]
MRLRFGRRTFAALIDQDGVALIEYRRERDGFRVLGSRVETRRFETIEAAADATVDLLEAEGARRASVAVALQHFGAFYHSMALPQAADDILRPVIEREAQRIFNVADPAVAFSRGPDLERRETARGDAAKPPQQVVIAGAPRAIISALHARLAAARLSVDVVTVVPETLRRVYEALDGSAEPTAMLVCLASGAHLAFFIDRRLELAIEPQIALEGERNIDPAVVVDQVERGSVFLRQQARGAVATRLLLAAQPADYPAIAAALEGRTKLIVQPLAKSLGAPEAVVAMGAVLESRSVAALDLYPRAPTVRHRVRKAIQGPGAIPAGVVAAAGAAAIWAGVEFATFAHARTTITSLTDSISRVEASIVPVRQSVEARAGLATIRTDLDNAGVEQRRIVQALARLAAAVPAGLRFDSLSVVRAPDGWRATVRVHSTAERGGDAIRGINSLFQALQSSRALTNVAFDDSFGWTADEAKDSSAEPRASRISGPVRVSAGLTFLVPAEGSR